MSNQTEFNDDDMKSSKEQQLGPDSGFLSGACTTEDIEDDYTRSKSQHYEEDSQSKDYHRLDSGVDSQSKDYHRLDSGVDIDYTTNELTNLHLTPYYEDEYGNTQLHLAVLDSESKQQHCLTLIQHYPYLLNLQNNQYKTALHYAVEMGQWAIVRWLVIAGCDLTVQDECGNTPLHYCHDVGLVNCVCSGIGVEEVVQVVGLAGDVAGIIGRHKEMVKRIVDGVNFNGQTPSHYLIYSHPTPDDIPPILHSLHQHGANLNLQELKSGQTCLHLAVRNSQLNTIRMLIKLRVETELVNYSGWAAGQVARLEGKMEVVSVMEGEGVEVGEVEDEVDLDEVDEDICT